MVGTDFFSDAHRALRTVSFIDDFMDLVAGTWNTTVTDSGTVAAPASTAADVNGFVTLTPSDGTVGDNDEAYLYTNLISKYLNGKPISVVALVQFAEANTNAANILFGVGEGFGVANTLQDNGAGPPADYDGACFFKVDGGTRWQFESSLGTSQNTTDLAYTAGGSTYIALGIDIRPKSSSEMVCTPWIATDGYTLVQALEYTTAQQRPRPPVKHTFSYSSPGAMALCFGVKNGSTTLETLNVDLVVIQQTR